MAMLCWLQGTRALQLIRFVDIAYLHRYYHQGNTRLCRRCYLGPSVVLFEWHDGLDAAQYQLGESLDRN